MKGLILSLAVLVVPSLAMAQGDCDHNRLKSAQISCAEGQVWDDQAGRCVVLDS